MGSRNDMMFEGEEQGEYERLTRSLYQAMTKAIVAAANASIVVG